MFFLGLLLILKKLQVYLFSFHISAMYRKRRNPMQDAGARNKTQICL